MLGRIQEIIDNSVTIKLSIDINSQPSLINLHVVLTPLAVGAFLIMPVPNYHNMRVIIRERLLDRLLIVHNQL